MNLRRPLRRIVLVAVPFACLLIGTAVVQPVLPKTSALTRGSSTLIVQERASNLPTKLVILCNAPFESAGPTFHTEADCTVVR